MKKTPKKLIIGGGVVALILILVLIIALSSGSASIEGRWELYSVREARGGVIVYEDLDHDDPFIMEFFSDGTGLTSERGRTVNMIWAIENDRLMMNIGGRADWAEFRVTRSSLTISYEERGTIVTLTFNRATGSSAADVNSASINNQSDIKCNAAKS